jgi:hypothetical protein
VIPLRTCKCFWKGKLIEYVSIKSKSEGSAFPSISGFLFLTFFFFFFFFLVFRDRVSLCSPGCPGNLLCRTGWARTQKFACLSLPSAGIEGVCHHARLSLVFSPFFSYCNLSVGSSFQSSNIQCSGQPGLYSETLSQIK